MGSYPEQLPPQHSEDLANAPIRCGSPIRVHGHGLVPCGKCFLCREAYARVLSHRIDLERGCHEDVAFTTLTYRPEDVPPDGCLQLRHMQLFLKRLRHQFKKPLRYYYCAEYGEANLRPHYHAILFGYPACLKGKTYFRRDGQTPVCCDPCKLLFASWGMGRVESDAAGLGSGRYVALYATKGRMQPLPPELPAEFAKWSTNPGLGSNFMRALVPHLEKGTLPPSWLDHGDGQQRPLGRYLRGVLAELLDTPDELLREQGIRRMTAQKEAVDAATALGTTAKEMGLKLEYDRLQQARVRKSKRKVRNG